MDHPLRRRLTKVEIVTDTYRVLGHTPEVVGERRLVDVLNSGGPPFLALSWVSITQLARHQVPAVTARSAQIGKPTIAFAIPHELERGKGRREPANSEFYVQKERWQVSASMPPFEFTGYIHLAMGIDIEEFWQRGLLPFSTSFIPLTEAEARS